MNSIFQEFNENGYVILKDCITSNDLSLIEDTARNFIQLNPDYIKKDYPRIVNLHMQNLNILNLFNNETISNILNKILNKFTIYTSLFFQYPTQQPLHMDSPVFHTYNPQGNFVGFWIALEDAGLNNGALEVVPKSHLVNYLKPKKFIQENKLLPEMAWSQFQNENLENLKIKLPEFSIKKLIVKKREVVIWHANLMHGGSTPQNLKLTRKSMVFHITGFEKQVYQHNEFFNEIPLENLNKVLTFGKHNSISYHQTSSVLGDNR